MFHRIDPSRPQPAWKRPVYLATSAVLGLTVSYGFHVAIELWWIAYAQRRNIPITWSTHVRYGSCALPPIVQYGLLIGGLVGGYLTGRVWWRWVYLEGRWRKR